MSVTAKKLLTDSGLPNREWHWYKSEQVRFSIGIGFCLTLTTAFLGIFLEHLYSECWSPITIKACIFSVLFLLLALITFIFLQNWNKTHGTALQLEFQSVTSIKINAADRTHRTQNHGSVQVLSHRLDMSQKPVADVAAEVHELCLSFTAVQNADIDSTGTDVIPDMIAPVALAVGYAWQPVSRILLREINRSEKTSDQKSAVSPLERFRNLFRRKDEESGSARPDFKFQLDALKSAAPVESANGFGARIVTDGSLSEFSDTESDKKAKLVRLQIHMSKPRNIPVGNYGLPEFSTKPDKWIVCGYGVTFDQAKDEIKVLEVITNDKEDLRKHCIKPEDAVVFIGETIRQTLLKYPNAAVLLSLLAPKTVNMAVGWYLANAHAEEKFIEPIFPWRRLIPLWYDEGFPPTNRPMRVRQDQPDPAKVLAERGIAWDEDTGKFIQSENSAECPPPEPVQTCDESTQKFVANVSPKTSTCPFAIWDVIRRKVRSKTT